MKRYGLALVVVVLVWAGCGSPPVPHTETAAAPVAEDPGWRADLEAWKARRDATLRRADGWLTLVGLFWLEEGDHTFGSGPAADLVFPPAAPPRLGTLRRSGRKVSVTAALGAGLTADGRAVDRLDLVSDADGEPTKLEHGTLSFYVIERGERVGLRLKDSASELLTSFTGMDYYPADPAWRIEARWEAYDKPKTIGVPNITGDVLESSTPGVAVFSVDGREIRLEPTGDPGGELFFVFGDETNGTETYGGGRFLYAGPPENGTIVLDFNRAYNPPCVFTAYSTCPLPRPEDTLALAVRVGEKTFAAAH